MSPIEHPRTFSLSRRMSLRDLPPRDTRRWVASRKAAVVIAVCEDLLTEAEACLRYDLTPEELDSWKTALANHGVPALHVKRGQHYRKSAKQRFCQDPACRTPPSEARSC